MKKLGNALGAVALIAMVGCYHATVETGLPASGQTVKKEWAHGFIAGLVPPSVISVAEQCPNGVAKVETQLSFLNQIANIVTFGIYTPMTIEVHCAAERQSMNEEVLDADRLAADNVEDLIRAAAVQSYETGSAVFIRVP